MDEPHFRIKILVIQLPHNLFFNPVAEFNSLWSPAQLIISQGSSVFNGMHSGSVLPLIEALIATLHSTCFQPTWNHVNASFCTYSPL